MWLRGNLVVVVLLVCLAQNVSTRDKDMRETRKGKRPQSEKKSVFKGKFTARNLVQCMWIVTGGEKYILKVTCNPEQGETRQRITCAYTGDPKRCPAYTTNTKGYWKQISRSIKNQKKLCLDNLVRASMCKHAPQDAHFRLTASSASKHVRSEKAKVVQTTAMTTATVNAERPESTRTVECAGRSDHSKRAEEMCGSEWASVCTFIFTFVQSGDC
ncbi:fibroblast growth factor-binding protein 1 [Brachyhypopomus gauderio]|uniref:fibroblast growth factor-binding protein 1 n=1 Tax=Brachyhypopomus gauderio TaxID=698409 RepID=UPI004040F80D